MDNKKLELILFKVGEKFLQYILNYDKPIVRLNNIDEYNFQLNQLEVLDTLNLLIEKCEVLSSGNHHSTIKQYLFQYGTSFNQMRGYCGGSISLKASKEELLNYIFIKGIEFYSCLLLVENNPLFFDTTEINIHFPVTRAEGRYISKLLSNHSCFRNITLIEQEAAFSTISYQLSNNTVVHCFVINFIAHFVERCFLNCCYSTKYDLDSLLNEIELQYSNLEKIATGETLEVSFYCVIYGLRLDGIEEFNLTENIIVRNINETNNPGIKHTISITTTEVHSNLIVGCVLEHKTSLKSLGTVKVSEYPIIENNQFIDKIFDSLINSCVIALNSIYPPISITFFDKNIPLSKQFPQIIENRAIAISILTNQELGKISEWFKLLNSVDLKYISLTLSRIKSAIYNRQYPIDSILDAFIAWESMFSSDISTTNSVVKSICKMLERISYNISKKELKELYSLRSSIVHGNPVEHKLLISSNPQKPLLQHEEIKKQTIDIAIKVLKELIIDKSIFDKKPRERVEILLNPTIVYRTIEGYKFE